MASTIQVILQQDLKNLGKSGELVRVRPGYARNYLIPRSLAVPATLRNVAHVEHEQKASAARAAKAQAEARAHADKISGLAVKIARKVGDEDRLFGSVTAKDIEAALKEQHGLDIDRKKLVLGDPIRAAGTYEVSAKLLGDVTTTFKVEVVPAK
jgi:large subunit ribosomal protein L9